MSDIEVTDEMVAAYRNALESHLAAMSPKQWEIERFDPVAALNRGVRVGLAGVFAHLASQPGDAWEGEVEVCDAKGMWLIMSDDCPLVPGQRVRIAAAPAPSAGRG